MLKSSIAVLAVIVFAVTLAGCPGDSARAVRWNSPSGAVGAANGHPFTPKPEHPHTPRKEAHQESFLSTYNNPDNGVSFRYPKNYVLEEGDVQEHSYFLKTQEQLDSEEPGAELVATLLIPEDAYPNTTFEHGSVQMWVHEAEKSAACRSDADSSLQPSRVWTSGGLRFDVTEEDSSVGGTSLRQRHYAGLSGGVCYEFLVTVAADESTDAEGSVRAADTGKILRRLEKIITAVKLAPKP